VADSGVDEMFFAGRGANVFYAGAKIGRLGVLHPDVLRAFDVSNPTVALELNIEPFV